MIKKEHIKYFQEKFSINLENHIRDCNSFFENDYPKLTSFFRGDSESVSSEVLNFLKNIQLENTKIIERLRLKKHLFENLYEYFIFDLIEDLRMEILVSTKLNKFLRSTIINPQYTNLFEFVDFLKRETLEQLSSRVLFSQNQNEDWIQVAFNNQLKEIDYTEKGGLKLNLQVTLNTKNQNIQTLICVINKDTILGKDIKKVVEFHENDLSVLSNLETFEQSVFILANLNKGSVPEFPQMGKTLFIGDTLKALGYSSTIREMTKTFQTDDTMMNFKILSIERSDNDFVLNFSIESKKNILSQQYIKL
jgi:hypothetical protein